MYAQKNGPYAVHIGQRPVNSPISPLFCQARRTCPELGAFRTHNVLGNLSLMGNALCVYTVCVCSTGGRSTPIPNFESPEPKFMPKWAFWWAPKNIEIFLSELKYRRIKSFSRWWPNTVWQKHFCSNGVRVYVRERENIQGLPNSTTRTTVYTYVVCRDIQSD